MEVADPRVCGQQGPRQGYGRSASTEGMIIRIFFINSSLHVVMMAKTGTNSRHSAWHEQAYSIDSMFLVFVYLVYGVYWLLVLASCFVFN